MEVALAYTSQCCPRHQPRTPTRHQEPTPRHNVGITVNRPEPFEQSGEQAGPIAGRDELRWLDGGLSVAPGTMATHER